MSGSHLLAIIVGLLVGLSSLGLVAIAVLTAPRLRPSVADDGGPEGDRLIAEAMAAWREEAAWRIARRLEADGVTENDDQFVVVSAIMEELGAEVLGFATANYDPPFTATAGLP